MDQYTVVAANGQEYGPCDLPTLQQWIREGRIVASTPIRKNGAIAVSAEFLPETAASFRTSQTEAAPPMPPAPPTPPPPTPPLPRTPAMPLPSASAGGAGGWVPPSSSAPGMGSGSAGRPATLPTTFTVWGTIGQAWDLVRPHMVPLAVMCALPILPGFVPVIGGIASAIIIGPAFVALQQTMLGVIDGETPRVEMLFQRIGDRFAQGLLAYLAMGVGSALGFLLCIVPGVILTVMWSLTFVHLAVSQDDFWAAMKRSAELTKGYRLKIWLMFLAFIPLMILGMFAFCVGLFVAMAIGQMSFALTYRFLLAQEAARGGAARS